MTLKFIDRNDKRKSQHIACTFDVIIIIDLVLCYIFNLVDLIFISLDALNE